jgi:hypothetical protein
MRARTLVLAVGVAISLKVCTSRHRAASSAGTTVAETPGPRKPLVVLAKAHLRPTTTDALTRSRDDLRDKMQDEVQRFAAMKMGRTPVCRPIGDRILGQTPSAIEMFSTFECTGHYAALGGFDGRAKVEVRGTTERLPRGDNTWVGIPIFVEMTEPVTTAGPGLGRARSTTIAR